MKLAKKGLITLVTLGAGFSMPFVRAADDPGTMQIPITAVPDAPDPSTTTKAGKGVAPERMANMKAMAEKLNLTADQKKKIAAIRKSHADALKAARGDRAKMADLVKTERSEVRAVLTPDQQKQFDAMTPAAGRGKNKAT
jgi:hypothetical protein